MVIPTALQSIDGRPIVVDCLESLADAAARAAPPRVVAEIVLVTQGHPLHHDVIDTLAGAGAKVIQVDLPGPFNFSSKIDAGVRASTTDAILLLNDDTRFVGSDWPAIILPILRDETVGAVGPLIRNPDGSLNSAGDALTRTGPRHVDAFDLRHRPGLADLLERDRDVSLLTGAALAVRRSVYDEVGGFDPAYPSAYGDVDFCLRIARTGRRLVLTPRVVIVHRESSTRSPEVSEQTLRYFRAQHPASLRDDPLLPPLRLPFGRRIARLLMPAVAKVYRWTIRPLLGGTGRRLIRGYLESRELHK